MSADAPHTSTLTGLSEAEATARLKAEGTNELPQGERRTPFRIVLEVVREPMLLLLICGCAIYLLLGDLAEALVLMAFAMMSILITVVQETRTERVLEALRDLTSPRALVIRDGTHRQIAGKDVVRGDLLVLSEGDRIAADALLLECHDLQTDESLLTGESVPVRKIAATPDQTGMQRPGGDDLPCVFSGTLVVRGAAIAEVMATGVNSEIGKIGTSLGSVESEVPRLQRETGRVVLLTASLGGALSVLAVVLYGLWRGTWLEAVLAGIALGMSMLPEEFPVVLAVFMAMGAWRISQANVLTRRASAIETLGSATVLCTDKTGTLTQNRMSVAGLYLADGSVLSLHDGKEAALPAPFLHLVETGMLASAPVPSDPMEKAFHAFIASAQLPQTMTGKRELIHSYGLRPDLLAMSQVWRTGADAPLLIAAKGAPEAIARLCRLDEAAKAAMLAHVDVMAADGLRVLGVASAEFAGADLPAAQLDIAFGFIGLVALADPLRPSVPAAMRDCRNAGIKVVMITGDYPATARTIARQAGLAAKRVVSGDELAEMSDDELARSIREVDVFARIMPEQKLRIVNAFKAAGEIVAMTGDGVNDAPSLKAAHIGIAMGGRGTDVAREASSIILLDDDFGSIVKAVRLGRRIYDNLRKAIGFIFAVHVPIVGLALLPLLFGLPIMLGPMHIAFLEMVIDPVCSLVFEAETEEKDVMHRPPRGPDDSLFSPALISWGLIQGACAFALVALIYMVALGRGMPENEVRALAFFSLVLSIVSLIFVNRSFSASLIKAFRRPNPMLGWVLLGIVLMLALTLLWPFARGLFRFGPLHPDDLGLTLGAGLVVLLVLELVKPLWRRYLRT